MVAFFHYRLAPFHLGQFCFVLLNGTTYETCRRMLWLFFWPAWYLRIRRTTTVTLKESMPVASLYSWYGLHDGNSGHDMVWANPTMLVTMVTSRYFHWSCPGINHRHPYLSTRSWFIISPFSKLLHVMGVASQMSLDFLGHESCASVRLLGSRENFVAVL